ncbi:putative membrane protein [Herbaspirillum sp. CF444]|uniref:Mpo1 family 2-hydroxy fatty acid dioxygenase n=1 Tax=Herbaspirillum sp. CF444 TaxID=1144319 RepID=UPI0002727EA2|nr:Mpo1-like protein [Herbaspirillum sp. CF444]EJL87950.1 putative membrane protein [Herbaspirillum sp. CF444]
MNVITHRRIDLLLARYAESHRHPLNEAIHCICVPAIVLSLLGLLWSATPLLAVVVVVASLVYYLTLSPAFAFGMLAMAGAMLLILSRLPAASVLPASVAIFVAAWIGQFIGHKIEGKKPSFFEDLRFLLIGPLFVLSLLYRRWRIPY